MTRFSYVGSGPYCYANALAMMFGPEAPPVAVIEFATASGFGMQLVGGTLPFFDPHGWTPEAAFDAALAALGWSCETISAASADEAYANLRAALAGGPVWTGPLEMGHLAYHPTMSGPIGADHYLVVLAADDETVTMHDPHGFPYVTLPRDAFLAAWRADTLGYGTPFTLKARFHRTEQRRDEDIIARTLPTAEYWIGMPNTPAATPGTLGNSAAALRLAELIEAGDEHLRGHLVHFAVRVGARRLADAADCLARIGVHQASGIMTRQAQIVGALQFPLVKGDDRRAAALLRVLAPTYAVLQQALAQRL